MATLSPSEIQTYAANAGFSGDDLNIAQAVALAESSGNPAAVGDNGNSVGLFQINLAAHPEYSGVDLTDPQTNADAAYSIFESAGGSFTPWTTYNTGEYADYLADSDSGVTIEGVDLSSIGLGTVSSTWILLGGLALAAALFWWAEG